MSNVIVRIGNRSWCGVHGELIDQRQTQVWTNPSKFISKHRISKASSFLNVISPDVEAISWFLRVYY